MGAAILYVLIAGGGLVRAGYGGPNEVFPFFAWDLFSVVPNEVDDYGVRVRELDHQPLSPPRFFEELPDVAQAFSTVDYVIVQQLGAAQQRGDAVRQGQLQRLLLDNLLGRGKQARLELVRRRFDVLERYRTGHFRKLTVFPLEPQAEAR